jgi:hypothetical protein
MRWYRFLIACLASVSLIRAADAHAPFTGFPVHHASFFLTKHLVSHVAPHTHFFFTASHSGVTGFNFGKPLQQLLTKGGLTSLHPPLVPFSGKLYQQFVANAIAAGRASSAFTGGVVTGGTLQGDLYQTSFIPGQFQNLGEFTGTVGVNLPATFNTSFSSLLGNNSLTPGFQNSLNFASSGGGVNPGAQFAGFGMFSGTWRHSFLFGQQLGASQAFSGGAVTGGLFMGTAYRNTLGSSVYSSSSFAVIPGSASYVFAFGNSPLNNPAGMGSSVSISNQPSFVLFGNGLNKTVTNGQILYPMINPGNHNGSVLTMAGNPANTGVLNQTLSNLSSFLFF